MPVIQVCTVSPAVAGLATIQTMISSATRKPRTFCNNGSSPPDPAELAPRGHGRVRLHRIGRPPIRMPLQFPFLPRLVRNIKTQDHLISPRAEVDTVLGKL